MTSNHQPGRNLNSKVMHIRKQQVIGLGADGVGAFQHERLCWLQVKCVCVCVQT